MERDMKLRKIMVVLPGKMYTGEVATPDPEFRTLDLFNNPPKIVRLREDEDEVPITPGFVLLKNVALYTLGQNGYIEQKVFPSAYLDKANVIFFFDTFEKMGRESDRRRVANLLSHKPKFMEIITRTAASTYFSISGMYRGNVADVSKNQFIALTHSTVTVFHIGVPKGTTETQPFLAVNPHFFESYTVRKLK